jgi:hypothetical protein
MSDVENAMAAHAEAAESDYEAQLERDAEAALDRITRGQSWADWMKVGELFCHGRKQAMLHAHTNRPEGKGYNLLFSGWMDAHPKLRTVDKATRNHAMQCFDNLASITEWRATLAFNQLQAINHPSTVLRRWRKEQAGEGEKAAKKASAKEELNEKVAVLEADNKKLRDKLDKGGENIFALSDTAPQIAMALAGNLSMSKLTDLHKALGAELAKKRKFEAERKRAGPR